MRRFTCHFCGDEISAQSPYCVLGDYPNEKYFCDDKYACLKLFIKSRGLTNEQLNNLEKVELQVGKKYKARDGREVYISQIVDGYAYALLTSKKKGDRLCGWTLNGSLKHEDGVLYNIMLNLTRNITDDEDWIDTGRHNAVLPKKTEDKDA